MGLEHAIRVGVDANGRFLAGAHVRDLGFAEVGLDPDLVVGNQRKRRRAVVEVVAHLQVVDFGDDAVGRRVNRRV
ncbi:hypothetical protein D3C71_1780300 [compost metagenome]